MLRIGLMSDTHSFLDKRLFEYFKDVDEIWHAGDIGSPDVADALAAFKPFKAVYGNIDSADIRHRYPEHLHFTTEGVRVWMTHIGGYPSRYPARIKSVLAQGNTDLFICGHSHILKIMRDSQHNLIHINPGACGNEGFHKMKTVVRFNIEDGHLANMDIVELGLRGR
jgi:uncharacterized protein